MDAFPDIPKVQYEGPQSDNPFAFRWYNPDELVEGKSMRDHFRFSVVYWHTFRGDGSDPFGDATLQRPWDDGSYPQPEILNHLLIPCHHRFHHYSQSLSQKN